MIGKNRIQFKMINQLVKSLKSLKVSGVLEIWPDSWNCKYIHLHLFLHRKKKQPQKLKNQAKNCQELNFYIK